MIMKNDLVKKGFLISWTEEASKLPELEKCISKVCNLLNKLGGWETIRWEDPHHDIYCLKARIFTSPNKYKWLIHTVERGEYPEFKIYELIKNLRNELRLRNKRKRKK